MQQELRDHVNEYKKNNRKKSVWRKVVQGLACCVVFCDFRKIQNYNDVSLSQIRMAIT